MVGELQPGVHVPTVNSTGKTDTSHLYIFLRIGETHAKKERERERELRPYCTSYRKSNSKWFVDLNVKPQTIKFLGKNIGGNLCDLDLGKDFLDLSPKHD